MMEAGVSAKIYESEVEEDMLALLQEQGFEYVHGAELEPGYDGKSERDSFSDVVLKIQLREALSRINPHTPDHLLLEAFDTMLNILEHDDLVETNEEFYKLLVQGFHGEEEEESQRIYYVDFLNSSNNHWQAVNQFTIMQNEQCRPDVILFVNGLPIVLVELKNPLEKNATLEMAYNQLQRYKKEIPSLFHYNTLMVISDGTLCSAGSTTAPFSRFLPWKSIDGSTEAAKNKAQLEVLIRGLLQKDILLELIRDFTVFEREKEEEITEQGKTFNQIKVLKKIAAYHQFFAVRKAVECTKKASSEKGDGKAGVVWHTQGSGKSLSMVFFSKKMDQELGNATLIVLTDRNDLDNQLSNTFASCGQKVVQIESNEQLKKDLKRDSGGMFFTTIQKFGISKEDKATQTVYEFPLLSERKNIIIVADEAHRTQYGFTGKMEKDKEGYYTGNTSYGFAKYIRDAFPHATFLGFTGTPIEAEDVNTPEVFGNYIDIYDIQQAVEDGATVPIFYESRLARIQRVDDFDLDTQADMYAAEANIEYEKREATRLEALIGHPDRINSIAQDIVSHFTDRRAAFPEGKGMIVTMSREIAYNLYKAIIKEKPEWHSDKLDEGSIKIVMTSSTTDEERFGKDFTTHATTKEDREKLAMRVKDVNDPLQLVIVRDMWLTGFDAPCLTTLYVDKPMKGHGLMQAIARVNRVFPDKSGGLVVDYLGIASDLKQATKDYTRSGGKGEPVEVQEQAAKIVKEKLEVVNDFFREGTSLQVERFHSSDANSFEKLEILNDAQEHILDLENREEGSKKRFKTQVLALVKAQALATPHKSVMATEVQQQIAFFHAVKLKLDKLDIASQPLDEDEQGNRNEAYFKRIIRELVQKSIASDGVVDILQEAGMDKPELSILSNEFLAEVKAMKRINLALELLKKLLADQIKAKSRVNQAQSKKLSERLDDAILRYQNKVISGVEIIEEMINLANEMKAEEERMVELGITATEMAFYDTLSENQSARDLMKDETLLMLASAIVITIRKKAKIDWTKREKVRAQLRVAIKNELKKYGYPPDQAALATKKIMAQTELLAAQFSRI